MSEKAYSAVNQQGSRRSGDPSETTRQTPLIYEFLRSKNKVLRREQNSLRIKSYLLGALHDGTFRG